MKINKIYINAFGKLKNYTLDFNDGLNIIFGENENGKSTIMAFIKMMFYGSGKKAQKLAASPRQKYTPWSGDTMGGRIYFEHNARRYCLEREFKRSDAYDRIILTDTDFNTVLPASNDIGTEFFGLSAPAFEKSLYIGSFCDTSGDEAAAGELNAKLSNLSLTGDEDTSYQSISKRIEAAKLELISKSGKKGKISEYSAKLDELTERFAAADSEARRFEKLESRLTTLRGEYEKIKSQYTEAKQIIDKESDIRNASKLSEYLTLKDKLNALNETMKLKDGKISDEMFVKKVDFCLNRLDTQHSRITELNEQLEKLKSAVDLSSEKSIESVRLQLEESNKALSSLKSRQNELSLKIENEKSALNKAKEAHQLASEHKKAFNPPLFIIGILLIALSTLSRFILSFVIFQPIITYILLAIGILLITLSFIFRPLDKALILNTNNKIADISADINHLETEKTELQNKIDSMENQINLLHSALNTDASMREKYQTELKEKSDILDAEREKEKNALSDLYTVFGRYSDITDIKKIRESLIVLSKKAEEQKQLKLRLGYICSDLGGISYEAAKNKLKGLEASDIQNNSKTDFEALKAQSEELNHRLSESISEISAITTELKTGFKNSDSPQKIKSEISQIKASLLKQKQFFEACELTETVLSESFAEVRRGYGAVLEKKTLDIFSRLTSGRYSNLSVSDRLDITVEQTDSFGTRALEYLSSGTIDQAYLSLRLAACELISEDASLPIIMDDSLSNYDDRRINDAICFLSEYSEKNQLILFTCHGAVCTAAENHGIKIKNM